MYEHMTIEYIMERMQNNVTDEIDKREGSIIYDALMPCAIELANMYMELDMVLNEAFADTASMEYLAKRAAERGLYPKAASSAHVKGKFYGAQTKIGNRYSCSDLNYYVSAKIDSSEEGIYYYELICEEVGSEPNTVLGQLMPATTDDYAGGLEYAEIIDIIVPGEDDEDQEVFRARYFSSFQEKAFGGNIADYKEKVGAIDGVGGVKVYPIWDGGGTVKLVIINSDFKKPKAELVKYVQELIDPGKDGAGTGIAPIGHIVTVEGVSEKSIPITFTITYESGYSFEVLKPQIETAVDTYFQEIAHEWDKNSAGVVRISQIEYRMLNIEGILDVADTALDGKKVNFILGADEIPVRGDVIG